jgi:hypothetical protein
LVARPASATGRKTVLIVAPDFTPSSYPPALRVRFFAQHLPEFGWDPTIVATEPRFYEWNVDSENEKLLDPNLEVIRTPALPVKWTRKLGIGDLGIRSFCHHWRALSRICRHRPVDLVFIPVPPNYSMLLGRVAHARFGIPYVIDYIDPVVTDYYWKLPRSQRPPKYALANRVARWMEPFALRHVAEIVGVDVSYTADLFGRYPWLKAPTTGIPYGGEPADFEYLRRHPRSNPLFDNRDGLLHLSYAGRGGPDIIPVLRALFQAVRFGLQSSPQLFGRLRLHFVGTTYASGDAIREQVLPVAREIGVDSVVEEHPGRVPYLTAIQILLDSHALLVLGSDSAHYTASKVFPYILAHRPLLAVFHEESSVVKFLLETQAGDLVTFDNRCPVGEKTEEIATRLREILNLPSGSKPPTRWESFEAYTARVMTSKLANVFDRAIAGARVTPNCPQKR